MKNLHFWTLSSAATPGGASRRNDASSASPASRGHTALQ